MIIVRLATARGAAVYDLGGKFGASPRQAAELLETAHGAGYRVGLSFHVGSQCMTPGSYTAALRLASDRGTAAAGDRGAGDYTRPLD